MFGAIAWGALWRPLRLLHFLVCPNRVLQWGSPKRPKHLKINGLGRFWGTLLGRPIWTILTKNAFPCSVALVLRFREAFPCSVALVLHFRKAFSCSVALVFLIFGVRSMIQHGIDERVKNIYKINAIMHIFK